MPASNRSWLTVICEERHPRYIDGKEIPNWQQGPTLSETVMYLGAKGWMLWDSFALLRGHGKLTFIRPERLVIKYEEKRARYVNGKEIPNWQAGPTVPAIISYLNRKGWVLHSDTTMVQRIQGTLTFIRPKQ